MGVSKSVEETIQSIEEDDEVERVKGEANWKVRALVL